jgi:hypothetical protein
MYNSSKLVTRFMQSFGLKLHSEFHFIPFVNKMHGKAMKKGFS